MGKLELSQTYFNVPNLTLTLRSNQETQLFQNNNNNIYVIYIINNNNENPFSVVMNFKNYINNKLNALQVLK